MKYNVSSDGITVWVNGEFSLLGRFGKFGIDVHRPLEKQGCDGECLYCTHESVTGKDWETFKQKMLEHHGVVVTDKHKPERWKRFRGVPS